MADTPVPSLALIQKEVTGQKPFYIVYVDDEKDLLDSVGETAKEAGIETYLTTSTQSAIEWITEHRESIALIISDLRMPEIDGFELRKKLLEIAPEIPFAILSAHIDREMALKGIDLKICGFIPKPITVEKFTELFCKDGLTKIRTIIEDRELRSGFVSETENLITDAEELLLALEQDTRNSEALNQFFGIVHTLKGASSFFEPKTMHKFAHRYEDILKKLQRNEIAFTAGQVQVLFRGFDVIKSLFGEFQAGKYAKRDFDQLLECLNEQKDGTGISVGEVQNKESAGEGATAKGDGPAQSKKSRDEVKVSVSLLNEFMALSGEVTVIRNMLNKCVRSIERQYAGDRDVATLADLLDELHKINGGVQAKISDIRKVPVKLVFKPLPRAIRDISKQLGKEILLKIVGEEVRIDAAISEVLNNSLLHIVKNSIDHGLELPDVRVKAGKTRAGTVEINCSIKNEQVIVEIKDDGKGINVEAIQARLLKNKSHTQEQIDHMTPSELYAMIFAPGFSTAAQVTDISGRGVGMSMVKDSVDALGGEIQIESIAGQGATFRLLLPVPKSVLIANCLTVVSGGMQVGLMQDDLIRIVQLDPELAKSQIRFLTGASFLVYEGDLIPLFLLGDVLQGKICAIAQEATADQSHRWIAVIRSPQDDRKIALEVDEILDVEDTVIKAIHPALNTSQLFRGITYLDDGRLGLIVSTQGVMDFTQISMKRRGTDSSAHTADANQKSDRLALTFKIAASGTYALPLEQIHRIEEVSSALIKSSGSNSVIPYREGVLEIVSLSDCFSASGSALPEVFPVLVVKEGERLLGLRVEEVYDMVSIAQMQTELADLNQGIEGHFFYQERTVTLLSLERVAEICLAKAHQSTIESVDDADDSGDAEAQIQAA